MPYGYHPSFVQEPTALDYLHKVAVAALMKFRSMHVCEAKPEIEISTLAMTVKVSAGAVEVFSFAELGF